MSNFDSTLRDELSSIAAASRYRRRRVIDTDPAHPLRVRVDGRECVNFCSNDYLGLAAHPALRAAMSAAVERYGVGSGASHLVTGHGPEHHALEEELAEFTGRERALFFSTGYMANLGIVGALLKRGDHVLEDRLNHASLVDAGLVSGAKFGRYAHADVKALERLLSKRGASVAAPRLRTADGTDAIFRSPSGTEGYECEPSLSAARTSLQQTVNSRESRTLILTDGVFSMDGDIAPLAELAAACKQSQAVLMVDDAHGFGVLGASGQGSVAEAGLGQQDVPIYMATLGKACGVFGAFVAGSEALIETLIQRARTYIYTTALPAAVAAANRAALKLLHTEGWRRAQLNENIEYFRNGAAQLALPLMPSTTAIQPVVLGEESRALVASEALLHAGLLVTAIRPPTVPTGTARLRITLSAAHRRTDIDRLLDALKRTTTGAAE